eukprot:scaffold7328_cov314-Pinguiococcus_pyrenoidosus.AAC.38
MRVFCHEVSRVPRFHVVGTKATPTPPSLQLAVPLRPRAAMPDFQQVFGSLLDSLGRGKSGVAKKGWVCLWFEEEDFLSRPAVRSERLHGPSKLLTKSSPAGIARPGQQHQLQRLGEG